MLMKSVIICRMLFQAFTNKSAAHRLLYVRISVYWCVFSFFNFGQSSLCFVRIIINSFFWSRWSVADNLGLSGLFKFWNLYLIISCCYCYWLPFSSAVVSLFVYCWWIFIIYRMLFQAFVNKSIACGYKRRTWYRMDVQRDKKEN